MSISSVILSFLFRTFSVLFHGHTMTAAALGITPIFPAGKGRVKEVCHLSLSLYIRKPLPSRLTSVYLLTLRGPRKKQKTLGHCVNWPTASIPRQRRDLNLGPSMLKLTLWPTVPDHLPSLQDPIGPLVLRNEDLWFFQFRVKAALGGSQVPTYWAGIFVLQTSLFVCSWAIEARRKDTQIWVWGGRDGQEVFFSPLFSSGQLLSELFSSFYSECNI